MAFPQPCVEIVACLSEMFIVCAEEAIAVEFCIDHCLVNVWRVVGCRREIEILVGGFLVEFGVQYAFPFKSGSFVEFNVQEYS